MLIAVPLIALVFLVGKFFANSYSDYRNMSDMLVSLNYVKHVVPLLTNLVSEQDATNKYIKGNDGNSTARDMMLQTRGPTNSSLDALNNYFNENADIVAEIFGSQAQFDAIKKKI